MKTKLQLIAFSLFVLMCAGFVSVNAQKPAAPYKVTNIKIVPFEQSSGEFAAELKPTDEDGFFNDLSKGLFVTVEVSGKAGDYDGKREIEVTVLEGKKVKLKKLYMSGIMNEQGKFYYPVWLDAPMCSEVKITARITGQKAVSTMTRKAMFQCGE